MKYSTSQKQYVDFLNTLTYTQQSARTAVSPASASRTPAMFSGAQAKDRNGIQIKTSGVSSSTPAVYACNLNDDSNFDSSNDGLHVSCNWLSWADGIAYADWAALRPMTELEFEKACRGSNAAVANEYPWGSTSIQMDSSYVNSGTASETVSPSNANINVGHSAGSTFGPTRVGIFAAGTTTRAQSGATHYGIMEMGGDVWERIVSVGSSTGVDTGRSYLGSHGDGSLSASGDPVGNSDWPGTNAVGAGFRGGCWQTVAGETRTSDRTVGAYADATRGGTNGTRGFRCVRTAP
jgi:formylglycine-generating enzyme required for sulfatase activity